MATTQLAWSGTQAPFPIAIRSGIELDPTFEERIRSQLAAQVGYWAGVERATVRFEDVNGPKGGVDTVCRIKLVLRGRPTLFIEKRDISVWRAFAAAVHAIGVMLDRTQERAEIARR